jgi:hypothetical protein
MWSGSTQGPVCVPGAYRVNLRLGARSWTQPFEVRKDPRVSATPQEFQEQFDLLLKIRDTVSAAHRAVNAIRDIRKQTDDLVKRLEKSPRKDTIANTAKRMNDRMKAVEEEIIQVKIKSGQDALNYPIKLNDKIAGLMGVIASADTRPTRQSYDALAELAGKLSVQLAAYRAVLEKDLPAFNALVKTLEIPAIVVKPDEKQ